MKNKKKIIIRIISVIIALCIIIIGIKSIKYRAENKNNQLSLGATFSFEKIYDGKIKVNSLVDIDFKNNEVLGQLELIFSSVTVTRINYMITDAGEMYLKIPIMSSETYEINLTKEIVDLVCLSKNSFQNIITIQNEVEAIEKKYVPKLEKITALDQGRVAKLSTKNAVKITAGELIKKITEMKLG